MGVWKRILVPTDFSESAERALGTGLQLARHHGAELHFLRVVAPLTFDPYTWGYRLPDHQAVREAMETEAREAMEESLEKHEIEGLHIRQAVMGADRAGTAIVEYAAVNDIDLITMGTHGRRGLQHLLLGSTAEETVRRAHCTVLVTRALGEAEAPDAAVGGPAPDLVPGEGSVSALGWRRVLLPIDFSEASLAAVEEARELSAEHGATLYLLHVVAPIPRPLLSTAGAATAAALEADALSVAAERLGVLVREALDRGVRTVAEVRQGQAGRGILDFASSQGIDLLVIPTHGLTGLPRLLLGSIAEKVVRHSSCPVLVLKPA